MTQIRLAVAAIAACIVAAITFGAATTSAQPSPAAATGSATAGSATATGTPPAAGSATPEAGSATGSASAAPPTKAAGSGAGSADKPVAKVEVVDCNKFTPDETVKVVGGKFEIAAVGSGEPWETVQPLLATGKVVRFELPATDDAESFPKDVAVLHANAGAITCVRYNSDGEYRFHSASHPIDGTIFARPWYDILAERPAEDGEGGNFWLPEAVNKEADDSDMMFMAVLALSVFFFVAIAAVVVYFTVKYRHRPGHAPQPSPAHNDALEITWTVIPTIIVVFLFYYGWHSYVRVVTPPTKAVEIQVQAKKWSWNFVHENGVSDADLHIPANTPVRFVMTSQDVLHSFYIPVMRIKQDIVPRRYTYAWVYATKPGTYRLTCAEYCGTDHSQMGRILQPVLPNLPDGRRRVVVVHENLEEYEKYLEDKNIFTGTPEELGAKLYLEKGCSTCHTTDGSPRIGPSWGTKDWGQPVPMQGMPAVTMDENYLRESILDPPAKARPNFDRNQMPHFDGLKESEVRGLIAYIKQLKTSP
jgi:cytochrome c oxidase subunit 2